MSKRNFDGANLATLCDKVTVNGGDVEISTDTVNSKRLKLGNTTAPMDVTSSQIDFHNSPVINFPFPTPTVTTLSGTNTAQTLVENGTGPALAVKDLQAGNNMVFTDYGSYIRIDDNAVSGSSLSGTGAAQTLVYQGSGPNFETKDIQAGNNIYFQDNGTYVTINATALTSSDTLTGTSTAQSLVYQTNGPNMQTKDIQAGSNMSFTDNGTYVTLNATGGGGYTATNNSSSLSWDNSIAGTLQAWTTVTTTGSGNNSLLYSQGTSLSDAPRLMELQAGSGCTITNNGTYYTISVP